MNKIIDALKLAENTLEDIIRVYKFETGTPVTALAAIREALAEPDIEEITLTQIASRHESVKQEPVAVISESAIGLVKLHANGVILPFGTPLYAAPVQQAEQEPIEYLMEVTCSKCGTTESGVLKFKTPQPVQEPVAWAAITKNGKLHKAASSKESAERKRQQYKEKFGDSWPLEVVPLYAAPQPITTPDVCGEVCARAKLCYGCNKDLEEANAKYVEKAEQEPVAFIGQGLKPIVPEDLEKLRKHEPGMATLYDTPLYAAPVKREWVDLTDDEIFDAYTSDAHENTPKSFARAVVAAWKAKNEIN